jgi:hypothetical protein
MYFACLCTILFALLCVLGVWLCLNAGLRWYQVDRVSTQLAGTLVTSLRSGTAYVAREVHIPESNENGLVFPADIVTTVTIFKRDAKGTVLQDRYELSQPMVRLLEPLIKERMIQEVL